MSIEHDFLDWYVERPPCVQALSRRFPPGCTVRALVPLRVPGPGQTGTVASYGEAGGDTPDGWLGVVGDDPLVGQVKAQCLPGDLEVVAYAKVTPEVIRRALGADA